MTLGVIYITSRNENMHWVNYTILLVSMVLAYKKMVEMLLLMLLSVIYIREYRANRVSVHFTILMAFFAIDYIKIWYMSPRVVLDDGKRL